MRGDSIYLKYYLPSQVGNSSENKQNKTTKAKPTKPAKQINTNRLHGEKFGLDLIFLFASAFNRPACSLIIQLHLSGAS